MAPYWDLTAWAVDPVMLQPFGVDFLTIAALQARLLAGTDTTVMHRWAELVAVRRGAVGGGSPDRSPSTMSWDRSRWRHRSVPRCAPPLGDGACAVVLGVPRSGSLEGTVLISGTGHDLSPHYPGDGNLSEWAGLRRACSRFMPQPVSMIRRRRSWLAEPPACSRTRRPCSSRRRVIGRSTTVSPDGGLFAERHRWQPGSADSCVRCGRWRVGPVAERWPTAPGVPRPGTGGSGGRSTMRPVAVIGTGQTKHAKARLDVSQPELGEGSRPAALEDAGIRPQDVDAVVISNMDPFEGEGLPPSCGWRGSLRRRQAVSQSPPAALGNEWPASPASTRPPRAPSTSCWSSVSKNT